MIRRLLAAIRELRIAHHQRLANAFGVAALAAQRQRDFPKGAAHLMRSMEHRSKRDALAASRAPAAQPDPVTSHQVARRACRYPEPTEWSVRSRADDLYDYEVDWTLQTR